MKQDLLLEKQLELGNGLSIWKVSLERCREQDKNARVMGKATFDLLKKTIEEDHRLESLPFGYITKNPAGNEEFKIISGHHRLRAARSANLMETFVMVTDEALTDDQVKAKQLAHNALSGHDDEQVLKELYNSIQDIDAKIRSGVMENELDKDKYKNVKIDDIQIDFDFRIIKLVFLNSQFNKFDQAAKEIQKGDTVMVVPQNENEIFTKFADAIRQLSGVDDIKNVGGIVSRMADLVLEYCATNKMTPLEKPAKKDKAKSKKNAADKAAEAIS